MPNWLLIISKLALGLEHPLGPKHPIKILTHEEQNPHLANLVCKNGVLTKKNWLNFLEFPFSNRYRRPETRPDLTPKAFSPLPGYLTLISTYPEWILSLGAKVISLPLSLGNLAHFSLTMAMQHFKSALGYTIGGCRVERECVGYPSAPPSNCQPPANRNCASLGGFTGRRIPGWPGVRIQCRQFVEVANSWG